MEFSVTVEPAIVEEHTHHPPLWEVVLGLSGSRGEIQITCKRENLVYMQILKGNSHRTFGNQ